VIHELNKNKLLEEVIVLPALKQRPKNIGKRPGMKICQDNEKGIIKMMDTLATIQILKNLPTQWVLSVRAILTPKFQLGPWYNWITQTSWEGLRLRFDLGTNYKFDRKWWWHTYLAYGFRDQKLKGKAELLFFYRLSIRELIYMVLTRMTLIMAKVILAN
jgi:hypothetical protein